MESIYTKKTSNYDVSMFLLNLAARLALCFRSFLGIHKWEMLGINSATTALLLGYGYTKLTMLLNVARVFLYRVPVLWAFQQFASIGAEAVGMTMMISNVCTGLTAVAVAIPVVRKIFQMAKEEISAALPQEDTIKDI